MVVLVVVESEKNNYIQHTTTTTKLTYNKINQRATLYILLVSDLTSHLPSVYTPMSIYTNHVF